MKSGSVAGAEMTTFFAPASRCFCAPSRLVKNPVDSRTTSTPSSPHGSAAGSRSESIFICSPPALMTPSPSDTSPGNGPSVESYFRRCAIVAASPRSLTATISTSAPSACCARKKFRPMRPKPLMPTRTAIVPRSRRKRCLRGESSPRAPATDPRPTCATGVEEWRRDPHTRRWWARAPGRWIQTPFAVWSRSAHSGGGGRPRSSSPSPLPFCRSRIR